MQIFWSENKRRLLSIFPMKVNVLQPFQCVMGRFIALQRSKIAFIVNSSMFTKVYLCFLSIVSIRSLQGLASTFCACCFGTLQRLRLWDVFGGVGMPGFQPFFEVVRQSLKQSFLGGQNVEAGRGGM